MQSTASTQALAPMFPLSLFRTLCAEQMPKQKAQGLFALNAPALNKQAFAYLTYFVVEGQGLCFYGCAVKLLDGKGVLITGAPGAGKSKLLHNLQKQGAQLIGDDYLILQENAGKIVAKPAQAIKGLCYSRKTGALLKTPYLPAAVLTHHIHIA